MENRSRVADHRRPRTQSMNSPAQSVAAELFTVVMLADNDIRSNSGSTSSGYCESFAVKTSMGRPSVSITSGI
jgi:hypothetical protein